MILKGVAKEKSRGFTLIELLVVISIIALLSSVVFASINSARENARDAKRKADIKQIFTALQLHYDKRGSYTSPENMCNDTSRGGLGNCGSSGATDDWDANSDLRDVVADGFLSRLPIDPLNTGIYHYRYEPTNESGGGQTFTLCANALEGGGNFCLNSM